jgi:hypothetical protein
MNFADLRKFHRCLWLEILECPEAVLEKYGHRMSMKQLRYCAYHAPDIAYGIRQRLSPRRRAFMLGYTIEMAGLAFSDAEVRDYMDEIVDSMIDHKPVWTSVCNNEWPALMLTIQMFLGVQLGLMEDLNLPMVPQSPFAPELSFLSNGLSCSLSI